MATALHPALLSSSSKKSVVPIVPVNEDSLKTWLKSADKAHQNWVKARGFKGSKGRVLSLPNSDGTMGLILWGTDGGKFPEKPWPYAKLAKSVPDGSYTLEGAINDSVAFEAALGWALSYYKFDRYLKKSGTPETQLKIAKSVDSGRLMALYNAIHLTRDLVNTPTNDMGPSELSDVAKALAKDHKATFKAVVGDALLKQNFPTIHAVGRACDDAPRLIDLVWGKKSDPKVTLVGKGVCFDTGGLDIKPSAGMRLMKKDMGGAAHVLGLASAIMALKLPVRLRVLVPAVENSISANAFRPGDVIKTRKGLTVEVGNTDAEGRLVLCDALALADDEKPDLLIDFATLTGAARVALGPDLPALFTHNDKVASDIENSGRKVHDPVWRLPLWQGYASDLQSSIADLSNISETGFAGATMGGLFLDRFVEKTQDWVHLDIFAWNPKARPGRARGGAAQALRAMLDYLEMRYSKE